MPDRAAPGQFLAFPAIEAVLDYYQSTAYFKLAFDAEEDRDRLARRVARILTSRFKSGPVALTVGGAIFTCTGPIQRNPDLDPEFAVLG